MHDNKVPYPKVGKVTPKQKKAIQENFLMNDVSMALWTKARSLDELGLDIYAMEAYVECINMTHGRIWDSKLLERKKLVKLIWLWMHIQNAFIWIMAVLEIQLEGSGQLIASKGTAQKYLK